MANERKQSEFSEKIVQVNRVSKKTKGGNRIGFSVLMVAGDKKGRVGVGLGKAPSVINAIRKGASYAKKHLIRIPMKKGTIPHEIYIKRGAAKVLLKPALPGTGVIAGGPVRAVVEAAGIRDIISKILGTSNQASNVYATFEALQTLRQVSVRKPIPKDANQQVEEKIKQKEIKKPKTGKTKKTWKTKKE